jgi:hypothetical protein
MEVEMHEKRRQRLQLLPAPGPGKASAVKQWQKWDLLWQQGLSEVDAMIIDFFRSDKRSSEGVEGLVANLKKWFLRRRYDPAENAEIIEFVNSRSYRDRLDSRIEHLNEEKLY